MSLNTLRINGRSISHVLGTSSRIHPLKARLPLHYLKWTRMMSSNQGPQRCQQQPNLLSIQGNSIRMDAFFSRKISSGVSEQIVKTPHMADSITEGELARFEKKVGESVKENEVVAVIETDKVDIEVPSPVNGVILEFLVNPGDTVKVGSDLFKVRLGGPAGETPSQDTKNVSVSQEKTGQKEAPKQEKPRHETKPEISKKESDGGNITSSRPSLPSNLTSEPSKSRDQPTGSGERRVKMSRMRLRIAERLKESQDTAASLTTFNEIDMSNLIALRNTYKDDFLKKHDVKLGFMSAFVRASTIALQEIPEVNARIDGTDIVYNDYADISVAVATPKGLLTPVLRNCETMSFLDIEKAIQLLGEKARANQITVDDLAGGTFTISNGGVFGSLLGTPIINMPQSAILGMHAVKERPVAVNGEVAIRPMMYVALTYDHRVIDGREAVTFLIRVKELIEDPRRLLLDL